jgi:hypothetical protein
VLQELNAVDRYITRPNTHGAGAGITYNPEYLKVVWETLARRAGVEILLNAWVQDARMEDGRLVDLIVATRQGLRSYSAANYIDASGDADVCHFAGIPYELAGENEPAQTLTTTFKMANVDVKRRKEISKQEFHAIMKEAAENGGYQLPRKEGSDHITPVEGMMATIMTRLTSYVKQAGATINATDPQLLSESEMEGRVQALEYVRFLRDNVPGYEQAQLAGFGVQIGVRETRRVHGLYRLTRDDVLAARKFDDQIALCGAPIEDHHDGADTKWNYLPEGDCVGIPYRTLMPEKCDNLLVAGRCFSATHDAHAAVRSMAQTMAMGQAAGTAMGLAAKGGTNVKEVGYKAIRDQLLKDGALVEL